MDRTVMRVLAAGLLAAGNAHADVTGTLGFLSDYVFRGIAQADSVVNGALDFSHRGFYLGTWAADVGQGLEVDLYGGWNGRAGDFSYTLGYTGYFYTDDFDDTYQEINLKGGYGPFRLEHNIGTYANFDGPGLDYGFTTVGLYFERLHGLVGVFSQDFDGEYFQGGYGMEVAGVNVAVDLIYSTEDLVGDRDQTTLVLSVNKAFAIGARAE